MKKILIVILAVVCAFFVAFYLKANQFYAKIYTPNIYLTPPKQEKTAFNVLIFGYGGGRHDGAYLTDTIMVMHVDLKKKTASLVSVPRDLWVRLPTKSGADFHAKVNEVYQLELFPDNYPDIDKSRFGTANDASFTKYILSQVTGLPVDNYVAIDFEGFKKAVDILGGVDINVDKTFDDYQYPIDGRESELCGLEKSPQFPLIDKMLKENLMPTGDDYKSFNQKLELNPDGLKILENNPTLNDFVKNATQSPELAFPCRYEKLHFDKGPTHMNGETALKYARSRHSLQDGTDFGRAARQQKVIEAVKNKVISIGFFSKIIPLIDEMGNHFKTDITPGDLNKFLGEAPNLAKYTLTNLVLSDKNYLDDGFAETGQFILRPKFGIDQWSEVQTAISNLILGVTPTSTPGVSPTLTPTPHLRPATRF